jgi:hypothetical protein
MAIKMIEKKYFFRRQNMTPLQLQILSQIDGDIEAHFNSMRLTTAAIVAPDMYECFILRGRIGKKVVKKTKKDLAFEYLLNVLRVASLKAHLGYTEIAKYRLFIQKRRIHLTIKTVRRKLPYTQVEYWLMMNDVENENTRDDVFFKTFNDLGRLVNFVLDFRETHIFDKYDSQFHLKSLHRTAGELAFDDFFLQVSGDCCVCYDPTKSKTLCCKHYFCRECFNKTNNKCPYCRRTDPFLLPEESFSDSEEE